MTNKEITNNRPSFLSKWVRYNLPDYENDKIPFIVSNIDWILINKKRKTIMFLEEKTGNLEVSWSFKTNIMQPIIDAFEHYWCPKNGYKFLGYHIIRLDKQKIYFNDKEVSENELREILGMGDIKLVFNNILECF